MSCIYICDGCGKQQPAVKLPHGHFKPSDWYQRGDDDGPQDACSRERIEKIAAKTGKTAVVLPI